MSRTPDKNLITALDIGTSKVVAIVAEHTDSGKMNIIGIGVQPSRGLKKGVIVNIDTTVQAIQKAVEEAEHMADCKITSVCVGIAGSHIHSFNSNGVVAVRDQEVSNADVERVIEAAKAVAIPTDQRILHILPQEFVIDNQEGIKEPVGMSGVRLEAKVHMVSGSISAAQNIVKCVGACGLDVSDLVLEQLASSYSVLTEDEKELGVCLVDIGGGTADITVFTEGAIRHTSVIPIAGSQVTSDIAHALRIPTQYAEAIKIQHGVALTRMASSEESIEVKGVADRPGRRLSMQTLASVIEARYEELFGLIYQDLKESGFADHLASGIVLTGGASKMPGVLELAEEVFRVPVRLGVPHSVVGLTDVVCNPIHATGVGLLMYTQQQTRESMQVEVAPSNVPENEEGILARMKSWFSRHF
ncbi:MAG: cell division protein FtsA [Gammaproteobacteria bacterium]|jgi:cell division protein FtsA|nr:cell division protein FtsA [Gammaproteobacteria bacterium]